MINERIMMKLDDAIDIGRDKDGNQVKLPVFEMIKEIDGELYGIVSGYIDHQEDAEIIN